MARNVLVTGGAGYIGSHTCVALLEAGDRVIVVDDLSNSSAKAIERVRELAAGDIDLHVVDLLDAAALDAVFAANHVDAVIHFAGLKAVGESVAQPLRYWRTNVGSTLNLLSSMVGHGVWDLVFSSSATVYGDPERMPLTEDCRLQATNPYGRTKLAIEELLRDVAAGDDRWRCALLRYFNPVGAHPSGRIGEDPAGIPNNLMPYVMQVAVGRLDALNVFGDDYDTPDGTGVRDYVHVVDLAQGHVAALDALARERGCFAVNLGTGRGHSVLEVLAAASRAVGHDIAHRVAPRRPGDVAVCYADPSLARSRLGWEANRTLDEMCRDHWAWQRANPNGYDT